MRETSPRDSLLQNVFADATHDVLFFSFAGCLVLTDFAGIVVFGAALVPNVPKGLLRKPGVQWPEPFLGRGRKRSSLD